MLKNVRPGEALIVGAVVLFVALSFVLGFGPSLDLIFVLVFRRLPGFPLGQIILGAALLGGALLGLRLAHRDAAARRTL